MTDIQPPIPNERASTAPRIGVPPLAGGESIPAIARSQPRIVYLYWAGAVILGLAIWVAIFLAF